jgi:site-specific DNA recombinase
MRAAVYARVSTERQERQQTIDSQLAALRAWAEAGGHELNDRHVFRDEGHSGARLDRPGLDALRDAVRDGEVEVLGVLAPDRLARKYAYQVLLLEEFRRAGCAVAFLSRAISDDPGDQLLLQIQGAVAEYERALLGERFRRGKLQKARAGQFIGVHAPYGYRRLPRRDGVAGRLVVDETEAEVVRMLYGWLTEERLTLRQILKRLNAGPWLPRCGRRPWAAGTVHHILSDPVYAGTAYANRYEYIEASEPCGGREPGRGGKGCRRLRPQEQWIPIAVPALVGRATAERATAQLARNAALASRNSKRHNYLLRCLLTCGGCGLSMVGTTKLTPRGARRYYRCGGKDCVRTGRAHPCSRACVDGEALERAVWGHVRDLLAGPDRLIAQFRNFVAGADRNASREQGPERRLMARLDGLRRADARLLDAYLAEVISLAELTERRRQLAAQRCGLERQLERQRDLRRQRAEAQEVLRDLAAFCERVRGRLDEASFAEKQAVLQLVVERVIVHEDSLEIRHVIPLRSPPPGREGLLQANGRLRSDRVHLVPGPV